MKVVTSFLLVMVLVGLSYGQAVIRFGTQCPQPALQKDFDITKYGGRWFEYARFPNTFEMGAKCVLANYTLMGNDNVKVVNVALEEYSYGLGLCPWYKSTVAVGNAVVLDSSEPAKLAVRFSQFQPLESNYFVVMTDYVTYSVVYNCMPGMAYMPYYTEVAWVLTRERGVAPAQLDEIYERLSNNGIDPSYFTVTDHESCPAWPAED